MTADPRKTENPDFDEADQKAADEARWARSKLRQVEKLVDRYDIPPSWRPKPEGN